MSEHNGHRERLRRRYMECGLAGFSDHEALELLLTFAIPRKDTNILAHRLIEKFGSYHRVLEAGVEELMRVDGIGQTTAVLLSLIMPLGRRYDQSRFQQKSNLSNNAQLFAYCRSLFRGEITERFYVLCMDSALNVINKSLVSSGTVNSTSVSPRMVAKIALLHQAAGVVMCHNHPAGINEPSIEDVMVTKDIVKALEAIDIRVYDHVIVTDDQAYSMRMNHQLYCEAER